MPGVMVAMFMLAQAASVAPGTEVRSLTATVLDEDGKAVEGLSADDVALSENGVVRDITAFKVDERPLAVAVIVDSSESTRSSYRLNLVEAVSAFVSRLPSETQYTVWTTGDRPTQILDLTDDRGEASKALMRVAPRGATICWTRWPRPRRT